MPITVRKLALALAAAALAIVPAHALATDGAATCGRLVPLAGIVDPVPLPADEEAATSRSRVSETSGSLVPLNDLAITLGPDQMPPVDACGLKIRPGALMTRPAGCTMNWIFQDEAGALYIGTAGHCLGATNSPPRDVHISGLGFIGRSVYNVNGGVGNDFGLVAIDPSKYALVDPTMCKWGGPSGMAEGNADYTHEQLLAIYGWGVGYGANQATRGRILEGSGFATSLRYTGTTSPGDSGAPVIFATGEAAGLNTHGMLHTPVVPVNVGFSYGTRLDVALAKAELATGHDFTLVASDVPIQLGLGVPMPAP